MKLVKTVILNNSIIEYINTKDTKYRRFKYYNNPIIDWCVELKDRNNETYLDTIINKDIKIKLEKMYHIMIERKKKLERIIK